MRANSPRGAYDETDSAGNVLPGDIDTDDLIDPAAWEHTVEMIRRLPAAPPDPLDPPDPEPAL